MRFASERLALKLWWQRTDQETQAGRGLSLLVALVCAAVAALIWLSLFFLAKFDQASGAVSQSLLAFGVFFYFGLGLLWGLSRIGQRPTGVWLLAPDQNQRTFELLQLVYIAKLSTIIVSWSVYLGSQAELGIPLISQLLALLIILLINTAVTLLGGTVALIIRQFFHNFIVRFVLIVAALSLAFSLLTGFGWHSAQYILGLLLGSDRQVLLLLLVSAVSLLVSSLAVALLLLERQGVSRTPNWRYWFFRLGDRSFNASYSPTASFFTASLLTQLRDRSFHLRVLLVLLLAVAVGLSTTVLHPNERTVTWAVAMVWTAVGFTVSRAQGKIAGILSMQPLARPIRGGQLFWGYHFGSAVTAITLGGLLSFYLLPNTTFWSGNTALLLLFGLIIHAFCFGIGFRAAQLLSGSTHRMAEEGVGILLLTTAAVMAVVLTIFADTLTNLGTTLVVLAWAIGFTLIWLFTFKKIIPER